MIDVAGYAFPENRASIVCKHVWSGVPVLLFAHDSDGDIQFYCGEESHSMSDAWVLGLSEIKDHLRSMDNMPTVRPGQFAERATIESAWIVRNMND
ncbi:hypothetical protein HHL08_03090 [Sphingobium sp. AR-3-1]|uniref:Uncharacterized protein n=1 Tax=Sphingobium psychrophilum TaxID=2728834 RepID=A0A7X9WSN9_9SPHN|nr:hypothetical protein [Sphingobium psychrophilum]NML09139.1 hypothetical protein [Sphingobium psychrophilum]